MNGSCKLTLLQRERDGGGGQTPGKSEVRAQSNTVGRLRFFLGGRCSRISGWTPEAPSRICGLHLKASGPRPAGSKRQKAPPLSPFILSSRCSLLSPWTLFPRLKGGHLSLHSWSPAWSLFGLFPDAQNVEGGAAGWAFGGASS